MRDVEDDASEEQLKSHGGQGKYVIGDNARSQQIAGGDRSNMEAPKNSLLTKQDECGAKPPEAAHHVESHHRTKIKADDSGHAFGENACIEKENRERHEE